MDVPKPDQEAMVRVAVADLDDRFATIDRDRIESTVRRQVRDWFACSRVKAFVGVIAERHAREELLALDRGESAEAQPGE